MIRKIISISITLILLLAPVSSVFAKDNGNGNGNGKGNGTSTTDTTGRVDTAPPDPGIGPVQEPTKSSTVMWVLPYGASYYVDDADGDIQLDWLGVYLTSTKAPVEGVIPITGSGGVDTAPPDPGVSSGQDTTKTEAIKWVLPHGDTFIIDGEEVNIVLDWESLNITDTRQPGSGSVLFIGIGGSVDQTGTDSTSCNDGTGRGNCNNNGNGSNGGGPLHSDNCGGVWIAPGAITATAKQIAPNFAVIVGQDPDENGVTVEYNVSIAPTVVSYEKWTLIGLRKVACAEDDKVTGNGKKKDPSDDCPLGWHQVVEHIWACTVKERVYQEGIDELIAGASLKLESRNWITNELAVAYPGAILKHPDWGFAAQPDCTWSGDLCTWRFTFKIPVVDPGWYDIRLDGVTAGTKSSPARSFEVVAGQFGVYLLDNTALTQ